MASTLFPALSFIPTVTSTTIAGVSRIDLAFASAMTKGAGSIFVTDGVVQTVIDRATGLPTMRVVGATVTKEISLDQVSISGTHVLFDAAGLTPGVSWNIYMGAGTLLSGDRPYAGLSAPGQAVFSTPAAVEPPPPAFGASISLDGSSLKSGEDILVTITFTKAVTLLDPSLLSAGNATISGLDTYDEGKTWHATLTGKAATDAPSSTLRLDLGAVVAADGSRGAGVVESAPYAVDTLVAAYVGGIEMADDMGPYHDDGISNEDTMDLWGLLYGTLAEGEVFELVINGRVVDPAKIAFFSTGADGVMAWTYSSSSELDPDDEDAVAERFIQGENKVEARIKGPNGHSSPAASKTILVETDAPDIVAAPTGLVDAGKAIQISFNEKMYWDDNVEVSHDVKVVDSFGNTSWIDLSANQLSLDRMTLSFTPADHGLATGNTYRLYLPEGLTDLAGNAYAGPAVQFTTAGPFQDKAAPRLLQAYILDGKSLYAKGDALEFRLRFSEAVVLDAGAAPELDLSNDAVARYAGLSVDGKEMRFTYTVDAGDDTWLLDVVRPWSLAGKVRDAAGNVMQSAHIEFDGLSTANGNGAMVRIDTVVAAPGAPRLHAGSDTGTAGDLTTTNSTPRLDGSGAEAGATVSLFEGDVLLGTTIADSDGHWNLVPSALLGAGTHRLSAIQQDLAGNLSAPSTALDITILTLPAAPAAPVLQAASDTGASGSDRITSDNTPSISGKAAANATLTLLHNGVSKGTVTADANGDWIHMPAALADGAHSFTVRYADIAGHTGAVSSALSLTVDTNKPNVVGSPHGATAFAPSADIVITFDEALHWNYREGEDDLLVLQDGLGNRRSIRIDESDFSNGGRKLTLRAIDHELLSSTRYTLLLPSTLTDLAGNRLDEYEIGFYTAAPGAYAGPSIERVFVNIGDHTARAGENVIFRIRFDQDVTMTDDAVPSLGLSNGKRAQFTGFSADGNEMLFSYVVQPDDDTDALSIADINELSGHVANLGGSLLDAAQLVLGELLDGQGNETWLAIDTVAPDTPALPELDHDSNSASDDDLLTSDRTPTLEGMAQAGTRIEIYEGSTLLGSGYADDEGKWEASVDLALADGLHSLTVKHVDTAGNSSAASNPLALTIDSVATALGALALADGFDTGSSLTDGLTKSTRPDLKGTGAEAGAAIRILAGDTVVGTGTALANGSWTADLDIVLADGAYAYTAQQVDAAGNISALSAPLAFTVDATSPTVLARPVLAAASDTGAFDFDGITNDTTPTFTGSGAEAGATVVLMAGTRELGRGAVDGAGRWSVEVGATNALSSATHAVSVYQIDKAGNIGAASSAFSLVVDTVAPTVLESGRNLALREFQLMFSEEIIFHPSGRFDLKASLTTLANFTGSSDNWYRSDGTGGDDSVLNFQLGLTGLFKLVMNNDAIADLAGNVAVIGQPNWDIELPLLSGLF